ncbi:hypothetical protein KA111_01620 [Candidatus Woesebacteria bacterium]|nr:hypothetical protein [Candidatus Woesebacteria bacterium]
MKNNLIFGLIIFIFTTLIFRLVDIQIVNGSVYKNLAENNKTYSIDYPEERGVFLDRYDNPLVYNKPVYYKLDTDSTLYSDKTRISHEQAFETMSQNSDLIRTDLERMYLYPKSMANVLGFVGNVSQDDLDKDKSLHISDRIGKFGLEKEYQSFLRGSKGSSVYEINALGEKQRLIADIPSVPGKNIKTTLDPHLSEISLLALGDKKGVVVILDASNSEVLSLLSSPSFDSSVMSETSEDIEEERQRILKIQDFFSNPQKLFFNRAISGAYPPGSVFKIITSLAGLEGNKINENTSVLDEGVLEVGEYSYANWYYTQFGGKEGEISLLRAISRSNDIYFYKVAEWVGPEKLKEMANLFSLGEKSEIELQAEIQGVVPDPEWKQRVTGERWFLGNTYHMGIGQGDILTTPIQIAQLIQAIANRGNLCKATLINDESGQLSSGIGGLFGKSRCREVGVLEENINLVLEGMVGACSTGGTGFPFFEHNESILESGKNANELLENGAVACKTGTSEFGQADERGYRKTHGWFVSIFGTKNLIESKLDADNEGDLEASDQAEVGNDLNQTNLANDQVLLSREKWGEEVKKFGFPEKIVIVVLVESDEINPYKEGSKDAGPVVKAIFDWMSSGKIPATNN